MKLYFGKTWLNPLLFGIIGTVGVCVILPLYWMVVKRKKGLGALGITKKYWLVSLIVSLLLGGFFFFEYYHSFGIDIAIVPALILGFYSLWEIVFVYGWLQLRFEQAFGIIPAAFLAGLCFSLYHLGYGWYNYSDFLSLIVAGIMMAVIFRITKNILILWPFLWPVSALRGFKMGVFSPGWLEAGSSAIFLTLILIAIFIFHRVQKRRENQ